MAIPCSDVVGCYNFLPCSFRTRSASKGVAQADAPPPRGRRTEGSSLMRGGLMARNFTPVGSTAERYPGILSLGKPCNETVPAPPWHYSLTDIAYHPLQGYRCMIWGTAAHRYALSFLFHVYRPFVEDKHSRAGVSNDSIIKKSPSSITRTLHPFQDRPVGHFLPISREGCIK